MKYLLALLCLAGVLSAEIEPYILGIERLDNGNTLMAGDLGRLCEGELAFEVDTLGRIVWAFLGGDLAAVHTARRTAGGTTLITATGADQVLESDRAGTVVWQVDSGLSYPNEAYRLEDGNTLITVRDQDRVIEVDPAGSVFWSYDQLVRPHNASRLPGGRTLICNSDQDRVIEIDSSGTIVWQCADGLSWPRSAQRLANGNTLIADSRNQRVVEVDGAGREVWSHFTAPRLPYAAERLASGRTLVSIPPRVYEVDSLNNQSWHWPGTMPLVTEELRVHNPASDCQLWAEVHRPAPGAMTPPVPAVVLVPDGLHSGAYFDSTGLAELVALNGLAVMLFDVDGRGRSDPWPEDHYGPVNRAGLRACIDTLARMPGIDSTLIGIITEGYGITLASGMLADSAGPVRFLVDFEGPADRYQSCADSGGPVPVPPDSDLFWAEREAAQFMARIPCPYLRLQNEMDHNPRIMDNRHAIALVDSATAVAHGGGGISPWTRVNDSVMNEPNRVYTLQDPPAWIPERSRGFTSVRYLLYMQELLRLLEQTAVEEHPPVTGQARSISARPNPFRSRTALDLGPAAEGRAAQVFDASGRLVRTLALGATTAWDGRDDHGQRVAAGVYYCRVRGPGTRASVRLVRLD